MNQQEQKLLMSVASASCSIVLRDAPFYHALERRLSNPIVGDLVLEISKARFIEDMDGLGYLRKCEHGRYKIDAVNGHTVSWDNAEFRVVPTADLLQAVQEAFTASA